MFFFYKFCRAIPSIHLDNLMLESGFQILHGRSMKRIKMELTTFSKLIQKENTIIFTKGLNFSINLTGVGIGDGLMSPYHEGR